MNTNIPNHPLVDAFNQGKQLARAGRQLPLPATKQVSVTVGPPDSEYAPITFYVQYVSSEDRAREEGYRWRDQTPQAEQSELEFITRSYPTQILFHVKLDIPDWERMRNNQDVSMDVRIELESDSGQTLPPTHYPDLGLPLDDTPRDLLAASDELLFMRTESFMIENSRTMTLHFNVDGEDINLVFPLLD